MYDLEFLLRRVDDDYMRAVVIAVNFESLVAVGRDSVHWNPLAQGFDISLGQSVPFNVVFDRGLHSVNNNIPGS